MPRALVTGTGPYLGPAAATLDRAGFEVTTWEVGAPPPGQVPVDCYVQLPCGGRAGDLICRTDTLAAMAGRLRPNASVLLAVDEPDSGLLAAVATVLLEELGRPASRLAVVPLSTFEAVVDLTQWEIPTPPLVSAP